MFCFTSSFEQGSANKRLPQNRLVHVAFDDDEPPELSVLDMIYEGHAEGRAFHGDFVLTPEDFAAKLRCVIEKHLGPAATDSEVWSLCKRLHLPDLYLSLGCARANEAAWRRFSCLYNKYIHDVARFVCSTGDAARELGDTYSCRTVLVVAALQATTGGTRWGLGCEQSSRIALSTNENFDQTTMNPSIAWLKPRTIQVSIRSAWRRGPAGTKP